ncbi:hypothetical protein DFR28_101294 [Arenicella xantha]|uniref:Uncharacterized protein n=1 Tax=Arenicella xantha TaxID=644221 RepID=A0A395JMQ1_9GAMM|nr:hypothetical protein DFR28_101294 [Arenicella xantha]
MLVSLNGAFSAITFYEHPSGSSFVDRMAAESNAANWPTQPLYVQTIFEAQVERLVVFRLLNTDSQLID